MKGHFLDGAYYPDGVQSDREMPILLQIDANASGTWPENKKVILNLASGSVVEVFLPEMVFPGQLKFWVAEDGSTYRAFLDPDEGYRVDQSALYAIQHDPNGLAKAAYAARVARGDYTKPNSPAVDAGSDDAYGYDSTSTNPKVIDMNQPDIGYKYYRRVADDDPIEDPSNPGQPNPDRQVIISFKQPKLDQLTVQQFNVYEDTPEGWVQRTTIDPDPYHEYVEWDIKSFLNSEATYGVQLRTQDIIGEESDDNPEIMVIIDESKPAAE